MFNKKDDDIDEVWSGLWDEGLPCVYHDKVISEVLSHNLFTFCLAGHV